MIKMDTSPAMPEAPAPEMTRPRMTCHMLWPMPLCVVNIESLLVTKRRATHTIVLPAHVSSRCSALEDTVEDWETHQPTTKVT